MEGLANMMSNGAYISQRYNPPRTAHFDSSAHTQQQQQWAAMQGRVNPVANDVHPMSVYGSQQEIQLQMMQMELMRLQVTIG
jgi:dTDP-4-dehydrorhamnose 3,5-epimerase-like enzyme